MTKYIKIGIIAVCTFLFAGCVAGDFFDPSPEAIVMTGTDKSPIIKFAVEDAPAAYPVTVSATGEVDKDITVEIAIDNSLVEKYNNDNKTSYYSLPDNALKLEKNQVVIKAGSASSEASLLTIVSTEDFVDGRIYMIPVTIKNIKGGNLDVLETSRTMYLRISRVYYFSSLDISNPNFYACYVFPDENLLELPQHTIEIKFLANSWHSSDSDPISRLCNVSDKNETGYLYRIGENGYEKNQLQVKGQGTVVLGSNARFSTNVWYTLSVTFDGTTTRLYVDGVRDCEQSEGYPLNFQRVELGMSWGTGHGQKQRFDGRVAEFRIWDRALSASEIQLGLCGVDPASEGLKAYWKLNDGEGHIFKSSVEGYPDIDWSNVIAAPKEDAFHEFDKSQNVTWNDDDKNKCVN